MRTVTIAAVLLICTTFVFAEFTIGPVFGYGIGMGKESQGTDYETNEQDSVVKNENLYYSAGQGLKLGLGAAYKSNGVGFGLDFGYSMGFESDISKTKYYSTWDSTWNTSTGKMKTSYIFVSPNITVEKAMGGLTPFCTAGLTVAIAPKSIGTYESETSEMETEITHNIGFGGYGVVGVRYDMPGGLGIVGQVRMDQLAFKAKHSEVTKYTIDGEDQMADWTTRDKETDYEDDDTADDPSDDDSPEIQNTFVTPANSFSVMVAIVYTFGGGGGYRR